MRQKSIPPSFEWLRITTSEKYKMSDIRIGFDGKVRRLEPMYFGDGKLFVNGIDVGEVTEVKVDLVYEEDLFPLLPSE